MDGDQIIALEDGSSIQPEIQLEPQEPVGSVVYMPDSDSTSRQLTLANQSQHPQDSNPLEHDDGMEDLRSIYRNMWGLIPDPLHSYTGWANPSTLEALCAVSPAPSTSTSTDKYTDRSSLLDVILKNLPPKADAINMMDTYYQMIAIEFVLPLTFPHAPIFGSRSVVQFVHNELNNNLAPIQSPEVDY